MDKEQRDALYGASARFSDHKEGETIVFFEGGQVKTGTILHVRAPGPAIVGGQSHPMLYVVDTDASIPSMVAHGQILEGAQPAKYFYALLATYGRPGSACQSREEAENLAENVAGEVITGEIRGETKQLRVIMARVEGDEKQGDVVGECEEES